MEACTYLLIYSNYMGWESSIFFSHIVEWGPSNSCLFIRLVYPVRVEYPDGNLV